MEYSIKGSEQGEPSQLEAQKRVPRLVEECFGMKHPKGSTDNKGLVVYHRQGIRNVKTFNRFTEVFQNRIKLTKETLLGYPQSCT